MTARHTLETPCCFGSKKRRTDVPSSIDDRGATMTTTNVGQLQINLKVDSLVREYCDC